MEPTIIIKIIFSVLGTIGTFVGGYLLYKIKQADAKTAEVDNKLDEHSAAITRLENTAVTDSHVRAVVKEEIQPLASTINRVADSMDVIKEYIAEDKGFKAGQAAAQRRKDDERNRQ